MSESNEPNASESNETDRTESERRDSVVDRRVGLDRRDGTTPGPKPGAKPGAGIPGAKTGLERRRGPGRRRSDYTRSAEEGEMTPEQYLFVRAIDAFKRVNNRSFPTWTEVLEVMRQLGYRKTVASELNLKGVDDWTEAPDAPAMAESAEREGESEEEADAA